MTMPPNPKDAVGAKKAPLEVVPPAGAIMSAPAHQNGADKYGPFNWRLHPVQYMTYLGAMQRHIAALIDGEDVAEDSAVHHLGHIIAGANILADALALGNLIDNRPPKGPAPAMLKALDRSVVQTASTDPVAHPPCDTPGCWTCNPVTADEAGVDIDALYASERDPEGGVPWGDWQP